MLCFDSSSSVHALQKSINIVILTIAFVTRVATVDYNSPLWQPACNGQYNPHGGQEQLKLLQGLGSLLRNQIGAIRTQERTLFPCKEP